jgi:hypothetical protein
MKNWISDDNDYNYLDNKPYFTVVSWSEEYLWAMLKKLIILVCKINCLWCTYR